jgi:lipopolysaccharide biosynthesis glycosyltransferase
MPTSTRDLARVARFRLRQVTSTTLTRARALRNGTRSAAQTASNQKGPGGKPGRGKASVPDAFFASLIQGADLDAAFVRAVRRMIASRHAGQARALSQAIATHPGMQVASDLCRAMVAEYDPMVETAWQLMQRNDLATVLRLIPVTYVRIGLQVDRDTTVDVVRRAVAGELDLVGSATTWLKVARACFVHDEEELARAALDRATKRLRRIGAPNRASRMRKDITALRAWVEQAREAAVPVACPAGEIPFAVLDYRNPDPSLNSTHVATSVETLSALGQLARRSGIRFRGEQSLAALADEVRDGIPPPQRIDGMGATIHLYRVDRDASSYSPVPDGTWLVANGEYVTTLFKLRYDLPLNPRLRPIFIGAHVDVDALTGEGAVDYLKRYAPIGCQDWNTVYVLQAADVPAFFSGPLTATLGTVISPDADRTEASGTIFIGTPSAPAHARKSRWHDSKMRHRPLAANVRDARTRLEQLRSSHRKVVTTDANCYWSARALGCAATIQLDKGTARRHDTQYGMNDNEFAALKAGLQDKLAAVLDAITAGRSEDDVYARWREVCAADVARAEARGEELADIDPPSFDVAAACDRIRSESVTIERSQPGPAGDEINIEFSLDANLKHEMGVVLESIVTHASRPIRLFVLCRDHTSEDYKRMAALFPTVSFVWLPTDRVYYGEIVAMIKHITIATMDRLLLPDLLPDIDRILHHDLDALCCADIAGLYDIDLGDAPLAARDQLHPNGGSAYRSFARHASKRFRARPQLGSEFLLRQSRRHPFDPAAFNAGFMVLNLARMRADKFTRNFLPYIERFGQNDQGVLNSYAASTRVPFDYSWNTFAKIELQEDPKIIHWLGSLKPWRASYVAERDRWREADAAFTARAKAVG